MEKNDLCQIIIWSDGTWCEPKMLYDYLKFMSDDYERLTIDPKNNYNKELWKEVYKYLNAGETK